MSERAKIEDKLHRKEVEIQALEEKIKVARIYVQALRDVLRLVGGDAPAPTPDGTDTTLKPGSSVAKARDVILQHGTPVHINEMLSALGKDATREARASLIGSISAYVRKGEIFTRPAPNTFGLIELGHDVIEAEEPEPPQGFGNLTRAVPTTRPTSTFDPGSPDDDVPF